MARCTEDEKPVEKYTVDNIPPVENNGIFTGKVGTADFSASHVAAGVYLNPQMVSSGNVSVTGLRINGTDTTLVTMVLVTDISKIETNKTYSSSGTNLVYGLYYNNTQNSVGGGIGNVSFSKFDRNSNTISGSFSFSAMMINQTTSAITNLPVSMQFSDVKYFDLVD